MKKDPEHLEEVANLFKTYIPYTNGKITRFFAPYDGKVHLHTNESETVFSDIPLYSIFPSDRWYDKDTYSTMTNGFMLKSNIKGSELVKKGDLICTMYCSPPGSSVHGILQARILEWGAISFSRVFSQHVSCIGRWILYH